MPVKDCKDNGKPGLKWGDAGKCYTYTPNNEGSRRNANKQAIAQGLAIGDFSTIGEITCKNCGWKWNISDGGNDPYICHKCGYDNQQKFEGVRVSFDYDDTLTTKKGLELLRKELDDKNIIYIISARQRKSGMLPLALRYNIPGSRVFATGSNQNKVDKLKELKIAKHYDNSQEVIDIAKDKQGLTTKVIKV
jgi:hypothetical protein